MHYFCATQTQDWFYLWLDPTQILPYLIDCWVDNMRLIYDNKTRTTRNNDGVEMKIPDFGNTTSVEYLDVGRSSYALYFGNIVDALVEMGYERKKSIFAAPYDFRKAANEQEGNKGLSKEQRQQRDADIMRQKQEKKAAQAAATAAGK